MKETLTEWKVLDAEAQSLFGQGQYDHAGTVLKRALQAAEEGLGQDHYAVGETLHNLALLHKIQGQYVEAEPLYKRALAIEEAAVGPDHPNVATSLENMAKLYRKTGREKAGAELERRAAAIKTLKR